ncbi:ATP-binding protein [bacterium 1xD8-6]|nr:ATP-binding protein [bacterium D16-36]RKI70881.1 ATP-binding protein [bacterium 1xD8-6]
MITNKDLKRCSQQVFTYSAQYQAPFYGREKSMIEMENKTAKLNSGEILIISQPLGTGKTFLVNHMIAEERIGVPRGSSFLTAKAVAGNPELMKQYPGDILIIDEVDIKTKYENLLNGMNHLQEYLDDSGKKAIVIGDFSLKDPKLSSCLRDQQTLYEFEQIDRDFLRGVLNQRFQTFMKEYLDADFCIENVIDPELIDYLSPAWMKMVNSFRGVFSLLQSVVNNDKYIRYNNDKAYLEFSMFKEYLAADEDLDLDEEVQYEFLQILREYLRSEFPKGAGITRGFTVDELYQLAQMGGIDIEYDNFADDILYPLAIAELLISTGIPTYDNNQFIRRPAPFVPSLKLLLSVF